MPRVPAPLDAATVAAVAQELAQRDADLRSLLMAHGPPPLWRKGPGFETLVDIVLGQQVSLISARAALERLRRTVGSVTPTALVAVGEEPLRAAGITRQKAAYVLGLAQACLSGSLDLEAVATLPDDAAIGVLTSQRGVGRWTADIYLLMGLGRPDVWPATDLALIIAARAAKGLAPDASATAVAATADPWRPWRSVAALMLWQAYLIDRGRPLDE